jgi:hypothetical protein
MKEQSRQLSPLQSNQAAPRSLRYGSLCTLLLQGLLVLSISQTIVAAKQESQELQQQHQLPHASSLPVRTLKKEKESTTQVVTDADDDLWCKIVVFDVLFASNKGDDVAASESDTSTTTNIFYGCYPVIGNEVSERHYTVTLPDAVVAAQPAAFDLDNWWVVIPEGTIDSMTDSVVVPDASTVYGTNGPPTGRRLVSQQQLDRHHSRRLAESIGDLKVLVVYIVDKNGVRPTRSKADVFAATFTNPVSLKSQFKACSQDQLKLNPTGLDVLEVQVNLQVSGAEKQLFVSAAEDLALVEIQKITNDYTITNTRQYADLIMFIVPPGTRGGDWLAYASVGGGLSVYNDQWGSYLSATAHEVGYVLYNCSGSDTVFLYVCLFLLAIFICAER